MQLKLGVTDKIATQNDCDCTLYVVVTCAEECKFVFTYRLSNEHGEKVVGLQKERRVHSGMVNVVCKRRKQQSHLVERRQMLRELHTERNVIDNYVCRHTRGGMRGAATSSSICSQCAPYRCIQHEALDSLSHICCMHTVVIRCVRMVTVFNSLCTNKHTSQLDFT